MPLPDGTSQPFIDTYLYAGGASEQEEEVTVVGEVVLRNGYALGYTESVAIIEVSGSATLIDDDDTIFIEVTGNCTITFS